MINTHTTEDFPELIAKWEERTRQRGANLDNVKHRNDDGIPATNINIVTRGGKKMREDRSTTDPPLIVRASSPKKPYQPERQKYYYHKAAKMFEGMTKMKED